ncbi:MAG: hypothetical protein ACYS80_23670, partial [Planctomycetota bacterium]
MKEVNILLIPVFLPLIAGFAMLFLPHKLRSLTRVLTLTISVATFALAVWIFISGESDFTWSVLQLPERLGGLELELMLSVTPLGAFMLMFAMGFGMLITLYSLKSIGSVSEDFGLLSTIYSQKSIGHTMRVNEYYGAILLTIGGSAGILLSNHLLFLLIFWEIVTVSLYLLIATGDKKSNFAATKSFAM